MTTTVFADLEGATDYSAGALFVSVAADPYADLKKALPKLAIPAWVWLIGEQLQPLKARPLSVSPEQLGHLERKRAARKPKRSRFLRALAGEHTRVSRRRAT